MPSPIVPINWVLAKFLRGTEDLMADFKERKEEISMKAGEDLFYYRREIRDLVS